MLKEVLREALSLVSLMLFGAVLLLWAAIAEMLMR